MFSCCISLSLLLLLRATSAVLLDKRLTDGKNHDGHFDCLVTLKQTADLSAAFDVKQLFEKVSQNGQPLANAGTGILSAQSAQSFAEFVQNYDVQRARFVYEELRKAAFESQAAKNIQLLFKAHGIEVKRAFAVSNSFLVSVNTAQLQAIRDAQDVLEIYLDAPFRVPLAAADAAPRSKPNDCFPRHTNGDRPKKEGGVEWNIRFIRAPKAWAEFGASGDGMLYANADTGVDFRHPALAKNYAGFRSSSAAASVDHNYAWYDGVRKPLASDVGPCGVASNEPCDDNGHGTHTMSTAVGRDGLGVAPGARWIACRNMDRGIGSTSTYLACLDFFLAPTDLKGANPRPELRPHVIGNSYGCPDSEGCSPNAFRAATRALSAAGIIMSVSAGNNGPSCNTIDTPPAYEPLVITVGALDYASRSRIAPFSSRGPVRTSANSHEVPPALIKPDFVAPGVNIRGAAPRRTTLQLSGTSMASPHVSGVLLLMAQKCSCMRRRPRDVYRALKASAFPIGLPAGEDECTPRDAATAVFGGGEKQSFAKTLPQSAKRGVGLAAGSVPNYTFGYGMVDAYAAVKSCMKLCERASSPPPSSN